MDICTMDILLGDWKEKYFFEDEFDSNLFIKIKTILSLLEEIKFEKIFDDAVIFYFFPCFEGSPYLQIVELTLLIGKEENKLVFEFSSEIDVFSDIRITTNKYSSFDAIHGDWNYIKNIVHEMSINPKEYFYFDRVFVNHVLYDGYDEYLSDIKENEKENERL